MSLNGKVAVVTGSASGIGRAISLQLGKEGAAVAVWDLNGPGAKETVHMIATAGDVDASPDFLAGFHRGSSEVVDAPIVVFRHFEHWNLRTRADLLIAKAYWSWRASSGNEDRPLRSDECGCAR